MDQDMKYVNNGSNDVRDYSFAFDNLYFSDCILHIELMPDSEENGDGLDATTKMFKQHPAKTSNSIFKRKRGGNEWDNNIVHDHEDASKPVCCFVGMDCSNVALSVRNIHVNSAILAEMCPLVFKLFANAMLESEKRRLTFHIRSSEEEAFINVLRFMYRGALQLRCTTEVLDVLIIALKLDVTICVDHCLRALQSSMSIDSALRLLQLLPTMLTNHAVQSLVEFGKKFLVEHLGCIEKFSEVLLDLPLVGIEAVLSSDELRVESEDAVYDFVISWARKHYPNPEKRREILGSKIFQLIRFPNMSNHKLKDVISCDDLDYVCASKTVSEALLWKVEASHKILNQRAYRHLTVTVMEFDGHIRECMVFWSTTKESLSQLSPGERLYSRPFLFSGAKFQFSAAVMLVESDQYLSVLVKVIDNEEGEIYNFDEIRSEYSVRMQPSCEFQEISLGVFPGTSSLIREGFAERIHLSSNGENSEYLINNMIYVRFVLKLKLL